MKHYVVKILMSYQTEVIADDQAEAFRLAYQNADNDINSYLDLEEEDVFVDCEWEELDEDELEMMLEDDDSDNC